MQAGTRSRYSPELREAGARRYLTSDLSYTAVGAELGVKGATVRQWVRSLKARAMSDSATGTRDQSTDARSPEAKLRLMLETAGKSEAELGEFLRSEGIHEGDLERWKQEALGGLGSPVRHPHDAVRIRELEKAQRKQSKQLREAEALLDLQKKVLGLWGDEDDDTTGR